MYQRGLATDWGDIAPAAGGGNVVHFIRFRFDKYFVFLILIEIKYFNIILKFKIFLNSQD